MFCVIYLLEQYDLGSGNMRILVVEDDVRIIKPIKEDLEHQQYVVDVAYDGEEAWELCSCEQYDLILLDWMLPKLDGITLCQRLRQGGYTGTIIVLTARGDKRDKLTGLDSGADDYIVKPFDIDELGARIRAHLRRTNSPKPQSLSIGDLNVDLLSCSIQFNHKKVDVTPTEYRLLITFLKNPGKTFSRRELIEKLWHFDDAPTESAIKSHIKGLRQKLVSAGCDKNIVETVFGFGYRLGGSAQNT
jgi:two-component system, OmpR family, response regulator QseB